MINYGAAWTELAAWIAAAPNRGRQAILIKMAELADEHQVPDAQLDDLIARVPQLAELLARTQHEVDPESAAERRPASDRPSIAA
jgi:hypothetical protein